MVEMFWVPIVRDVITVTGKDAASYLHSQLSQDVSSMEAGDSRQSFLLEPTGKIVALLRITRGGLDHFVLDMDPGVGDEALVRLNRFKIRVVADLELTTQTWRAIRQVGGTPIQGVIPAWRMDGSAVDVFAHDAVMPDSIHRGTAEEYERERIRAAWPVMGIDLTSETIPAESGVVTEAVSFEKGCYPGQELVERMDSRGSRAPRSLVKVDCAIGTKPGDDVLSNGAVVGHFTSVQGDEALALVKRGTVV
jgi:folate-binding protein YgfZ